MQHIQNICPNPITTPVGLFGDLFAYRHNSFSMPQINNDVTAVDALHNTIDLVIEGVLGVVCLGTTSFVVNPEALASGRPGAALRQPGRSILNG